MAELRKLFASTLAVSAVVDGRPLWVIDGTNWPRPAARASTERTWEYRPLPGWPQNGVVPAWAYQWLVAVPNAAGSWMLPLDVHRRGPTAKSATQVALEQIAAVRKAQPAGAARPVVTLDSGYDLETLAVAEVDADLLVRLAKKRVLYRTPNSTRATVGRACMASHFGWPTKTPSASRSIRRGRRAGSRCAGRRRRTTLSTASSASTSGPNST